MPDSIPLLGMTKGGMPINQVVNHLKPRYNVLQVYTSVPSALAAFPSGIPSVRGVIVGGPFASDFPTVLSACKSAPNASNIIWLWSTGPPPPGTDEQGIIEDTVRRLRPALDRAFADGGSGKGCKIEGGWAKVMRF